MSLSRPMASASTTCPKHPSPRGLPRISLPGGRTDGRPDAGGRTAGRRPAPLPPRSALTCPGAAPSAGPRGARTRRRRPAWGCRWRRGARAAPASRPSSWRSWSRPTPAAGPWVTFSWCLGPQPAAPAGGKALTGALRPPGPARIPDAVCRHGAPAALLPVGARLNYFKLISCLLTPRNAQPGGPPVSSVGTTGSSAPTLGGHKSFWPSALRSPPRTVLWVRGGPGPPHPNPGKKALGEQ